MTRRIVKYVVLTLIIVILQTRVAQLLTLESIAPDLLVIWVVYIALKEGQIVGTVWGFGTGLIFDLVTGNFIGLAALTKTIAGFTAGYFYNENKTEMTLGSYRLLLIVLLVSFLHNSVYFLVFTQGSEIGALAAIFGVGLATTFYTSTVSVLPMLAFSRRYFP
jgi:rod shape-determining protein MreD